ncbi:transposase [Geobacillus thermoleovorans]|uniref:transposase n=1 Tax=Geobacillus thermoleovorans TaxID=33941 RepID=UPI003D25CA31
MSKSIPNVDWTNQLESVIRQFVKEKLELIMREEIKNFLEIEQAGTSNMRNGYYQRNLDTQYGRIEGLLVPRDRNGEFQTQLFAPYQRVNYHFISAQKRLFFAHSFGISLSPFPKECAKFFVNYFGMGHG